ncbi:hypothetical protein BTR23_03890 [Alkalihalophilus pseudofirmus]|nr:hypothetical protein BTR23_03890 [Alkalihalophilus pseudofirmus]
MKKIIKISKDVLKFCLKKVGFWPLRKIQGIPKGEVQMFLDTIDKEKIEYVVIRWFENLPEIEDGEDIDILVADKDLNKLRKVLKKGKVTDKDFIKCDVYPESSQRRHMAYYPPHIAKRILQKRIKHKSGAWIPCKEHYLLSLAYHALFHKGFNSGLKTEYSIVQSKKPEHDYENYLKSLIDELNFSNVDITMEALEDHLKERDWLPPLDLYFRLSSVNNWVYRRSLVHVNTNWKWNKGTAVFVIREKGDYPKIINKTLSLLKERGIKIVDKIELSKQESLYFSQHTRGGDWGNGPYPTSGGLPKVIIIAKEEVSQDKEERIPQGVVEYEWVSYIKSKIRDEHLRSVKRKDRCNIIHSTDNGIEASYCIELLKGMKQNINN